MSPTMMVATADSTCKLEDHDDQVVEYHKGVKHLCEKPLLQVPTKYILPLKERPNMTCKAADSASSTLITLPTLDFAELQGLGRADALKSLAKACEQYGFFQVVNHGIEEEVIKKMIDVSTRFFEQPLEERAKYMSADMTSVVRYGTSFNQSKDKVFCWRDFLKLSCHPLSQLLHQWPSSPADMRDLAAAYAKETKQLFLKLMEAILETLGAEENRETLVEEEEEEEEEEKNIMGQFEEGSQLMVVNCYPPCPEPELTLGMPPHSDYGFLTLLLQDQVQGLQIQHQQHWVTVQPIPNSFVVNVGDHLEIFSNGKYKSVLHRVLVNPIKPRISVATLHSLPSECTIRPNPNLIDEQHPSRYMPTDFNSFLEYISSREPKMKNFLESRKVTPTEEARGDALT